VIPNVSARSAGIPPRWTSSAKKRMVTALNLQGRVWFLWSHGILNEVYFPRVDQACTRIKGHRHDGASFFFEEKRHCRFENVALERVYRYINWQTQKCRGDIGSRRRF